MAKRYLTKEEKRNFINWTRENANGTLLTSQSMKEICEKYNADAIKIGEHILSLIFKSTQPQVEEELEFEMDIDDLPFIE